MSPMDTLQTLLSLGMWIVGGGVLLILVALFVALAWMIVSTAIKSVRQSGE